MAERVELARAVHEALSEAGQTVAAAESLTAGLVSATLTLAPGSGETFRGGLVVYATELKHDLAGVPPAVLRVHGPVAAETARHLAAGARERCRADWGVATTGVAGPDGQDGHEPGEVYVAVRGPGVDEVERHVLRGGRETVREASVIAALRLLRTSLGRRR